MRTSAAAEPPCALRQGPDPAEQAADLLDRLTAVVAAQQAAIMGRDAVELVTRSAELERMLPEMAGVTHAAVSHGARVAGHESGRPDTDARPATRNPRLVTRDCRAVAVTARRLREQILLNQELLRVGMAAADHFALAITEAGASDDAALFSGVG